MASLIEMSIGAAEKLLSGSIIAFVEGYYRCSIIFSGQHILNLILGVGIFVCFYSQTQSTIFLDNGNLFLVGVLIIPIVERCSSNSRLPYSVTAPNRFYRECSFNYNRALLDLQYLYYV